MKSDPLFRKGLKNQNEFDTGVKEKSPGLWRKRLMWLLMLWAGSVAALALFAYALKFIMRVIGMSV